MQGEQLPANGVMKLATQVRSRPAKKAPVTKHPLFPAMVALWFGALFGLGSLAVRASLLESLILSLSLDVLLPAAAPPLGMNFRAILALLLAAIGVAVGAVLARRIAHPKQSPTPRRRSIEFGKASRQARAAAATETVQTPARRRALAIEVDERPGQFYEEAPLPGGSPYILDVTQIDLAPAEEAKESREAEPLAAEVDAPLALDPFVVEERVQAEQAPHRSFAQAHGDSMEQVFEAEPQAPQAARQEFRPVAPDPASADASTPEEPKPVALNFHPPVDAVAQPEETPLDLQAGQEVAPCAETQAEPEAEEYTQMVEQLRQIASPETGKSEPAAAVEWTGEPPLGHSQSEPEAAPLEVALDSGSVQAPWLTEPLPVVPPVLLADPLPTVAADAPPAPMASRIETAELSELSPLELIERLALAMRQRLHQGPMPDSLLAAVSSLAATAPAAEELPASDPAQEGEPETSDAPVAELQVEPSQQDELLLEVPEETLPAPMPLALPSALRPIDFSDYADDDDSEDLPLPPRSIAVPSAASPAAVELPLSEPEAARGEAPVSVDDGESEVPEDSYSSLLELGRPVSARQDFVRIEEPAEDTETIEPVVIFPGHGARVGMRFAAPDPAAQAEPASPVTPAYDAPNQSDSSTATDGPQVRRFDPPSAVASAAPAAQGSGIRPDPEEAQRALRSALATLQRMSGAA